MKILYYRYGSICEPVIIEGFVELGIEVSQIKEEITNKNLVFGDSARIVSIICLIIHMMLFFQ